MNLQDKFGIMWIALIYPLVTIGTKSLVPEVVVLGGRKENGVGFNKIGSVC